MKLRRNIRTYIVLAGFFSLILFSSLFLLNHLLMRADVQQYIIRGVCNRLGMDIQAEKMEFDILGITGLNLKQVRVRFRDTGRSMEAMNLHFRFSKRKLLAGDFFPVRIGISHPVIRLDETDLMAFVRKKEKGEFNAAAIFKGAFRSLNIENGTLIVEGPSGMGINGFYLRVEKVPGRANTFELSGRCEAGYKGKNANFNWGGNVLINTDDIRESLFKVELAADSAPLEWVPWPAKYVKMEKGAAESALIISGSINQGITIEGTIRPGPVLFTLANKGRSKSFEVNPLDCTIKASVKDRSIDIIAFEMKNKELDLSLDSFIDLTEKENPFIRLRAESLFMPIEVFARYFPFQITSPWLKEKLFPLFQQGRVRMDELLIEGKADQLRNLSDEKNRSVIGMTLTCESFTLGNMGIEMPVSGVSATVDIRDSNLAVDGLSGVFGQSRVNEARVHVMHMTSDTPLFTISVDGDYDIQELLTHRHFETIPQTAREKIEAYTGLVGRLSGKTIIGYQSDWEGPRMITGDFNFTETIYHKSPLELPLRFSRITFNFPENKPGNFEGSGLWGDMPFGLQGSTLLKGGGLEFTGAEIKGQADINRLVRSGLISDKFPFMLRKPLPVRVNVKKEGASYIY
ncbi:MAG: hypothetical protein GX846_02415, partial [Deltaproteobacteria bacterium]|nr:hypothetical protein [Deltaproteobacteria bacterium]